LKPEDLSVLGRRQRQILDAAAAHVRPGGRLVYSVCSLEPEEGESVIASFLSEHAEFLRADPRAGLCPAARSLVGADLALRTAPTDDGMDGFFAALLTRRSN
jgi:16S rRNA (cytosine967-C5)-methyltransferase